MGERAKRRVDVDVKLGGARLPKRPCEVSEAAGVIKSHGFATPIPRRAAVFSVAADWHFVSPSASSILSPEPNADTTLRPAARRAHRPNDDQVTLRPSVFLG